MPGPYSFLVSSPDAFDALCSIAQGRGVVVNPSKVEIENSFRKPLFPSDRREFENLLLGLGHPSPGIHLTHAEYEVSPSTFGDGGRRRTYNFFLDIDGRSSLKPAGRLAASMASELSRLNVPHWVKFSGSKGFHLHIPSGAFPEYIDGVPFETIAPGLFLDLKHMLIRRAATRSRGDLLASIIHPKRYYGTSQGIQRLPFSRHETTGLIAMPLADDEILGFEPPKPGEVDTAEVEDRASLISNGDGGFDDLISALQEDAKKPLPFYHRR